MGDVDVDKIAVNVWSSSHNDVPVYGSDIDPFCIILRGLIMHL